MSFISVHDVYLDLLLRIGGKSNRAFIYLYRGWIGIVGELLASRSRPFRFRDGILFVGVQNNSWMQELILHKQEVLHKCRELTDEEIKDIVFLIRSR
jgi:predicted nucleic acid-binding Zn ribbon protein